MNRSKKYTNNQPIYQGLDATLQTKRNIQNKQNYQVSQDFMTKNSNIFQQIIGLHYMRILKVYWNGITDQNILKYRPQYDKMVKSDYMWYQFIKKKGQFSVFKQILNAEKGPFVFIIIMSIVMGIISLFGAYCQRFLFYQHTQKDFHTSGWVFFTIIMITSIVKFFIFNYLQTLANQIAINIRIHLQNSYLKCLINLPRNSQIIQKSLVYFNYFACIQVVTLALKTMPYFVSSIVIVFGVIAFVLDIVGWLGIILLGVTLLAFFIQLILIYNMFHIHEHYEEVSNDRNSISIFSTSFFVNLIQSGLNSTFIKRILSLRKKQTNINIKYTISDGFIQIFAQSAAFFTVFLFYLIEQHYGNPSYKQIFQCVVLFSVFKSPVKMMTYGMAFTMQLYGSTLAIQKMFNNSKTVESIQQKMTFPRVYPHASKFWGKQIFYVIQPSINKDILLFKNQKQINYKGQFINCVKDVGFNGNFNDQINKIRQSLHKDSKYICIWQESFILNQSLRQNILFGSAYQKQKFQTVMKVIQLQSIINNLQGEQQIELNQNYIQTLEEDFAFKIQIGRALYNEVDILFINRNINYRFKNILNNVKQYRKNHNQITLIHQLPKLSSDITDKTLVFNKNGQVRYEKYSLLQKSQIQNTLQFKSSITNLLLKPSQQKYKSINSFPHIKYQQQANTSYKNIFKFYNYNHLWASIVLFILLCAPPLIDLYMEVIVAESKDFFNSENNQHQEDIHVQQNKITMRYGISLLAFFILNSLKVIVLSIYLRKSSYQIFKNLIEKFMNSKVQQTILTQNTKNALDLQRNLESMDIRTTTELDIGLTVIFQHLSIIVFASISSLLFLAVAIPFLLINTLVIITMICYSRKIFNARRPSRSKLNEFIKKIIKNRQTIKQFQKIQTVFNRYTQLNSQDITYQLNQDWLLQALSIFFEFIIILMLMAVMIISLTKFHQIHQQNQAFLQLSISFLIGFVNGGRLDLKVFKSVDRQVIGISSLFKMIEHHNHHKQHILKNIPFQEIQYIQYQNFQVNFFDLKLSQLNLKVQKGQRLVCVGNNKMIQNLPFLALFRLFDKQNIRGKLKLNDIDIYQKKISRQCLQHHIHIISKDLIDCIGQTVFLYIHNIYPSLSQEQLSFQLKNLWNIIKIQPLFQLQTKINDLQPASKDCFLLLIAMISKCQVLILDNCLNQIDLISRLNITQWLVHDSYFNIVVEITEKIQLIQIYPRQIFFNQGKIVSQKNKVLFRTLFQVIQKSF